MREEEEGEGRRRRVGRGRVAGGRREGWGRMEGGLGQRERREDGWEKLSRVERGIFLCMFISLLSNLFNTSPLISISFNSCLLSLHTQGHAGLSS